MAWLTSSALDPPYMMPYAISALARANVTDFNLLPGKRAILSLKQICLLFNTSTYYAATQNRCDAIVNHVMNSRLENDRQTSSFHPRDEIKIRKWSSDELISSTGKHNSKTTTSFANRNIPIHVFVENNAARSETWRGPGVVKMARANSVTRAIFKIDL